MNRNKNSKIVLLLLTYRRQANTNIDGKVKTSEQTKKGLQ